MSDPTLRHRRANLDEQATTVRDVDLDEAKKTRHLLHPTQSASKHAIALVAVTILAFCTTFYAIWYPAEVVFDEVHFGKFAGYYLQRSYFFDVHPPLAKMMIAAVGYMIGYDGHFDFAEIGDDYISNNVPYIGLRTLPATLNVMSAALVYSIMKESGYSIIVCALVGCMYSLDNSIVAQHRLIMLDSMLIFFILCTVYCYIKFRKTRYQEFSGRWWFWLFATGINMALTLSVKMVGLFLVLTIGIAVLVDLWNLLDIRRGLTMTHFMRHFYARAVALIFVPIAIYLFCFYIHFAILVNSGPGDSFMSTRFQETLRNSEIKLKSLDIHYYDNITLMHKDTEVYLHSHSMNYPLRYDDGRISSQGQQVTGVKEIDENTWWRIRPTKDVSDDEPVAIVHGDIVQLEHIGTNTILLTHDVASPLMATNEEVITVPHDTRYNETLFQVFLDDHHNGDVWQTHMKAVRLIHVDTKVALWTHSQFLPDWALGQQEVNGNKNVLEKSNYWVSTEIMGTNATEVNMNKKAEIRKMSFISKFLELQGRMISHNAGLTKPHPYQSTPITWPFMIRGISYWSNNDTREQIYMTGNVIGWYISLAGVSIFAAVMLADVLSTRRGTDVIDARKPQQH
ncbi:hypothetical protein DFQ28_002385 [Apophysomyces sp. BC1034]|nr:hypothetical protein DFQ29_002436 [Apophysomyces sp. BC1021]KAG0190198.1 hypothetical protein DFQ28_002385 [Apophysomyces sp. BC1034]